MNAAPVFCFRKRGTHLGADAVEFPTRLAAFGGNDTLCTEPLADMKMVTLTVKLGIGHHQIDPILLRRLIE